MNDELLKVAEIIERSRGDGALVITPAKRKQVTKCSEQLKKRGIPPIPEEYAEFLAECCGGFAHRELELFGAAQAVTKTGYTLPDIVTFNEVFRKNRCYAHFGNRLFLGRACEDMFCFNADEGIFESVDLQTFIQIEEYGGFAELFRFAAAEYLDDDS